MKLTNFLTFSIFFYFCASIPIIAVAEFNAPEKYPEVDSFELNDPDLDLPWSEIVKVKDEFDGDYLAIFDRNYSSDFWYGSEGGIMSVWTKQYIRVVAYQKDHRFANLKPAKALDLKIGDRVFKLQGEDSLFAVNDELAAELINAVGKTVKIRVLIKETGELIISEIGKETIKAWQTLYQEQVKNVKQMNYLTKRAI
jgi:hypothetical protein